MKSPKYSVISLVEIVSLIMFLFLSVRVFLVGTGFYEYADQYWSVLPGINSFAAFNPDGGFIFTRIIFSWPVYFFEKFPSLLGEKFTLVYLILVYFAITYIAITTIRRLLERSYNVELSWWKRLAFFYVSFIFIFANIESQNLFVDGGMVTDNIIMVLIILSIFLIIFDSRFWFLEVGAFLSITFLLDPDYIPMFLLAILVVSLFSKLNKVELKRSLSYSLFSILLMLPSLFFIVFNVDISTGSFLLHSTGLRTFSISNELSYSRNLNLISVLSLNGHIWSTMIFTAPTILLHISALGSLPGIGDPIDILVVPGLIYHLWYLSLFVPFIISILSLFYLKSHRELLAPLVLLVISVFLALNAYIPYMPYLLKLLTTSPFLGTFVSTALSLPGHFLLLEAASYGVLIIFFMFNFLTCIIPKVEIFKSTNMFEGSETTIIKFTTFKSKNFRFIKKTPSLQVIVSVIIVAVLLFSGWQAFQGDFFPARDNAFGPTLPNGLVDSAPFTPRNMTQQQLEVYNYLYDQKGNFSIYWPAIAWPSGQGWVMPKSEASLPYLTSLIGRNLTNDTYYYLRSNEVRYVVVQNNSGVGFTGSYPNLLASEFDFPVYESVLNFFDSVPHLNMIFNFHNMAVYVLSISNGVQSFLPLDVGANGDYSSLYDVFGSMGINPIIFSGQNFPYVGIDNSSASVDVISPIQMQRPDHTVTFLYNSTYSEGLLGNKFTVSNFTFTNWGSNSSEFLLNESNIILSGRNYSISSVSYNGNFVSHPGGFPAVSNGFYKLSVGFDVKNINNVSYLGMGWFNWGNGIGNEPSSFKLENITGQKNASYFFVVSSKSAIGARIFVVGNNYTISLKNITYSLTKYLRNSEMPFGVTTVLSGANSINLSGDYNTAYILLNGTGEINGHNYTTNGCFEWYRVNVSGKLETSGNYLLGAIVLSKSFLSNYEITGYLMNQYIPYLELENSAHHIFPIVTVNSMGFYAGSHIGSLRAVYYEEFSMGIFYALCVAEIFTLIFGVQLFSWKRQKVIK